MLNLLTALLLVWRPAYHRPAFNYAISGRYKPRWGNRR